MSALKGVDNDLLNPVCFHCVFYVCFLRGPSYLYSFRLSVRHTFGLLRFFILLGCFWPDDAMLSRESRVCSICAMSSLTKKNNKNVIRPINLEMT